MRDGIVDVVIPALNEEALVGSVVDQLTTSAFVREIFVVDNGSTDGTAEVARDAGANLLSCAERGLGRAMKMGLEATSAPFVLKTDADIEDWNPAWIGRLIPHDGESLIRLVFESPYDQFPVTRLVAEPLLRMTRPGEDPPPLPLTGTYLFPQNTFQSSDLTDDWSFDICLLCDALDRQLVIRNEDVGLLRDRQRPIQHYVPMATEILRFFVSRYGMELSRGALD